MRILEDVLVAGMLEELLLAVKAEVAVGALQRLLHFPPPKLERHPALGATLAVTLAHMSLEQVFSVVRSQSTASGQGKFTVLGLGKVTKYYKEPVHRI